MSLRRLLAISPLVSLLSACVAGPYSGDIGEGKKTDPIGMQGLAPRDATINIEFLDSSTNQWRQLKSAKASHDDSYTMSNGEVWYWWNASVVVPTWTKTCGYQRTRLRARYESGSVFLASFAASEVEAGRTSRCIENELDDGVSAAQAWRNCGTGAAGEISYSVYDSRVGNQVITTQAQADALGCVGQIRGDLKIQPAAGTTIRLPDLHHVTGNVTIEYARNAVGPWDDVKGVELPGLQLINGSLKLNSTGGVYDLVRGDFRMPLLSEVRGSVELNLGPGSELNFEGLEALKTVGGNFKINHGGGPGYYVLDRLAWNLETVKGSFGMAFEILAHDSFRSLSEVGGNVTFLGPIEHVDNFKTLKRIGGDLRLTERVPTGFLPKLEEVAGTFSMEGNSYGIEFDFGVPELKVGALFFKNNFILSLPRPKTVAATGAITIVDNDRLCTSEAERFVSVQRARGWHGTATISGNRSHCL